MLCGGTRLDRWYVPEQWDVLWTVAKRDDLLLKKQGSDHSAVVLKMEVPGGTPGRDRPTIREDLLEKAHVDRPS